MRLLILQIFLVFLIAGCSSDNGSPAPDNNNNSSNNNNNDTEESESADPTLNIADFSVTIDTPVQARDFSYYDGGYDGIFEDPDASKDFSGSIAVSYESGSLELASADIEVVWRSNLDGILFTGSPTDALESEITQTLSKGVHTIYLEASVPSESITVKDSVFLSNSVKLSATNSGRSVQLNWTPYEGSDFVSYSLYREDFAPLAEITNIDTVTYEDTAFNSFTDEFEYQIIVNTTTEYNHPVGSDIKSQHPGKFIYFPYYVTKMIKDPFRSRIYAIVRPRSNSDEADAYGLLIIDVGPDTFEINSHILQEDRFADMDMSHDGQYLFLCQERVEKLTRVNLNSFSTTTFETDTNDWGIHKIEVGNNNRLYCHRDPPTSGWTQFYIYNGNSGNYVNGPVGILRHGDIEYNKANNKLYGGQSNTSGGRMFRFPVTASNVGEGEISYPEWPDAVSYPFPFILLSDDDQHIFWENFQLDLDLNVIRTFTTDIKACSPNNVYLSDFNGLLNFSDASTVFEYYEYPPAEDTNIVFIDDNTMIMSRAERTSHDPEDFTYFIRVDID